MNFYTFSSNDKKFLFITFISFIILTSSAAWINYSIDPSGAYHEDDQFYENLALTILNSKFGVVLPSSVDDRKISKATALKFKNADCVIIGSSHIMQMSSFRETKSLPSLCNSIVNLGVSGASLEDYIILSQLVLANDSVENNVKLIFGLDPWGLGFNRDERWTNFGPDERSLIGALKEKSEGQPLLNTSRLLNLINFQYLYKSLSFFLENTLPEKKYIY